MNYPISRLRRIRRDPALRSLVQEHRLSPRQLIAPLFAVHGRNVKQPIDVLPDNFHLSVDRLAEEAEELAGLGVGAVLLFGIPEVKDSAGSEAVAEDGILQQAIRAVKRRVPQLTVIADTCMSMFTPNGASGLMADGELLNDESLQPLCEIALSQARAGADVVAPSAMLDGQIGAMRRALDAEGFSATCIMAYAAKFASCLYDPFFSQGGEAKAHEGVDYHLKQTHQINITNGNEAMREIEQDLHEGADMIMVKPGLWYLDIVWRARQRFGVPLAVYNVSGECAMLAAARGAIGLDSAVMESLHCCARAGAHMIITYFSRRASLLLSGS